MSDGEGRYRFGNLLPGDYTVLANVAGQAQGAADVRVQPGEVAALDIWLDEP